MQIHQKFVIPHAPEIAWAALSDARLVAECLPGAELDPSEDDRHYRGRLRVRLGPMAVAFAGEAIVERDPDQLSAVVNWTGTDARTSSRTKATLTYALTPIDDGQATAVVADAEVALSGALAQFGRGSIVTDLAGRLTAQFAENLRQRISAAPGVQAGTAEPAAAGDEGARLEPARSVAAATAGSVGANELKTGDLLVGILKARMAARLRRWADAIDPDMRKRD